MSFYGYDGHGSVRSLTNAAGVVTDRYDYDAYGSLINRTGDTPNVYLYAGEQWDADLGLYDNRARYLNVRSGRFRTMDAYEGSPEDPLSLHKYLYANGNPVSRVDLSGKYSITEVNETMRNMLSLGNTFLRILRAIDNVKIITEAVSVFGHTLKILMSGELDFYLYKSVEDVYQNSYSENPFSPKEAIESLKDNLVVLLGS